MREAVLQAVGEDSLFPEGNGYAPSLNPSLSI
jgi:hypothetical protein